jgi:peptidoglycan hydrolase-like protein with peptidoglycan-binding domain
MDEVEDRQPRLSVSAGAVLIAAVLLSATISYNALWRQALHGPMSLVAGLPSAAPAGEGSTRVVVDLDEPQPTTVTLRYDPVVEQVQRELAASGIYNGPIDGVAGKRTQLAIIAYQRMNQLDETGAANPALIDHIQLTRQFAEAADTTASLPADGASDSIRSVQLRLGELGYDPGVIDGELGAQTQIAIRHFQQDRGLTVTGSLSEGLLVELNKSDPRANHTAH